MALDASPQLYSRQPLEEEFGRDGKELGRRPPSYKAACINHSTALMLKRDSTVVASSAAAQKPSC